MTAFELALLVLRADIEGPAHVKLVAAVLASYVNNRTGLAFPAVSTLARLSGAHQRSVRRALASLSAQGVIVEAEQGRRGGRGITTRWRFNVEQLVRLQSVEEPRGNDDASVTDTVDKSPSNGDAAVTVSGSEAAEVLETRTTDTRKGDTGVTRTRERTLIPRDSVDNSGASSSLGAGEYSQQDEGCTTVKAKAQAKCRAITARIGSGSQRRGVGPVIVGAVLAGQKVPS